MDRFYYSDEISNFLKISTEEIIGKIVLSSGYSTDKTQQDAWEYQIEALKKILVKYNGTIYFEFSIPRMGRRIDVLLVIKNVLFILEFKVNKKGLYQNSIEQVWDYALDLKNFHETSQNLLIAPILVTPKPNQVFTSIAIFPTP